MSEANKQLEAFLKRNRIPPSQRKGAYAKKLRRGTVSRSKGGIGPEYKALLKRERELLKEIEDIKRKRKLTDKPLPTRFKGKKK